MRLRVCVFFFLLVWPAGAEPPSLRSLEMRAIELTNLERFKSHSPPLKEAPALADVARGHSQDMVRLKFYGHVSPLPGKRLAQDRARTAGVQLPGISENLCVVPAGSADPAADAVRAWMHSPGHASNLIQSTHRLIGIGVAQGERGYYFTQMFATDETPKAAQIDMVFRTKGPSLPAGSLDTNLPYTEADRRLAQQLLNSRVNRSFAEDARYDYHNARAFLYLAENHPDPLVVADALHCLSSLFSWNPTAHASYVKNLVGSVSYQRLPCDHNTLRVLRKALASPHDPIKAHATTMVRSMVDVNKPADPEVQRLLARIALSPGDKNRRNAIYGLNALRSPSDIRDQTNLTLLSDTDPAIVYTVVAAQNRLNQHSPAWRERMFAAILRLCRHKISGLRAAALEAAFNLAPPEQMAYVRGSLHEALLDPVSGVRAAAANLLPHAKGVRSLERLASLGNDMASIRMFEWPDGHWTTLVGLECVADTALRALHDLSADLPGVSPFVYRLRNAQSGAPTPEELATIQSEGRRAQEWVRTHRASLPPQE